MADKDVNCVREIAQALFNKKGSNIIAIDVKGISSITDYVIVADGNVDRHLVALAKEVEDIMKDAGKKPSYVEGMQNGDWIVLDYFQVVIHLFLPEMREKYQLERLWPDGKIINLNVNVS